MNWTKNWTNTLLDQNPMRGQPQQSKYSFVRTNAFFHLRFW